jgi:hypothetical protein
MTFLSSRSTESGEPTDEVDLESALRLEQIEVLDQLPDLELVLRLHSPPAGGEVHEAEFLTEAAAADGATRRGQRRLPLTWRVLVAVLLRGWCGPAEQMIVESGQRLGPGLATGRERDPMLGLKPCDGTLGRGVEGRGDPNGEAAAVSASCAFAPVAAALAYLERSVGPTTPPFGPRDLPVTSVSRTAFVRNPPWRCTTNARPTGSAVRWTGSTARSCR